MKSGQAKQMDDKTFLEVHAKFEQIAAWKSMVRDLSENTRIVEKEVHELIRERLPELKHWEFSICLVSGEVVATTSRDAGILSRLERMDDRLREARERLNELSADSEGE